MDRWLAGLKGTLFLSTLSLRRATHESADDMFRYQFLSTLSLRRATKRPTVEFSSYEISIHALLAESDCRWTSSKTSRQIFLSTLSLRRATRPKRYPAPACMYFYPRSPCGERLYTSARRGGDLPYFYPRSPCGERHDSRGAYSLSTYFYPRSPCGERPA